jgi:hypothetical protein
VSSCFARQRRAKLGRAALGFGTIKLSTLMRGKNVARSLVANRFEVHANGSKLVTTNRANALADVSMISANYGNLDLAEAIHQDWFRFLGGMPGEVVFVENGSPLTEQTRLFEAVKSGWITKLLSVRPGAFDIGKHQAFIAEVSALAMATRPFVLLYHLDVLVWQRGHDDWLVDAQQRLADAHVFAIGGSFNAPSRTKNHSRTWYWSDKLSGNFALLPRKRYQEAWLRIAGRFLRWGFRDEHPLPPAQRRFAMEVGFEQLMATRPWRTLVQRESPSWRIFHTNLNGAELRETRERFLRGDGIEPYLNAGDEPVVTQVGSKLKYYGHPRLSRRRRLRVAVGASPLGPVYRRLLGRVHVPHVEEKEPLTVRDLTAERNELRDRVSFVVFVDDASKLRAGLESLREALGGRPEQVVALLPVGDPAVDQAWSAHVDGLTDKLLVSRSLPVAGGISLTTLVDHGVFAHAHLPDYVLCRASALERAGSWLPGALGSLEGTEAGAHLTCFPQGAALHSADAATQRRDLLLTQIETDTHSSAMLGVGAPFIPVTE